MVLVSTRQAKSIDATTMAAADKQGNGALLIAAYFLVAPSLRCAAAGLGLKADCSEPG
jgi:hypothetical protein